MEQINLNIIPDGVMPVCHASQFDRDRTIRFNLTKNGAAYTLAGTETIKCKIKKPDNTENVIDVTNTSSTYVEVVFGYDDLDVSGDAMCELVIIDGSDISGSRNFLLRIEADAYDGSVFEERSASGEIASFETNFIDNLTECIVDIDAVQDLHGYSKPWSGGGGKNKLEPCITSGTVNGVSYTVNDDGTITLSNTATSESKKWGFFDLKAGSYIYTSGVTESLDTYDTFLSIGDTTIARGTSGYNSFTLAQDSTVGLTIRVRNGITPNITIKPMIRLPNTSTDFEPYENICPISGFTELNITDCGKNFADFKDGYTIGFDGYPATQSGRCATVNPIVIKPNTQYKVWASGSGFAFVYSVFNNDTLIRRYASISNGAILDTTGGNKLYVCLYDGVTVSDNKPMVIKATDTTDYAPYQANTYNIDISENPQDPDNPQIVYGGYYESNTGVLTINTGSILFNGQQDFLEGSANNNYRWRYFIPQSTNYNVDMDKKKSELLPYNTDVYGNANANIGFIINGASVFFRLGTEYTTNEAVKTFFSNNNCRFIFPLSEPIQIQLTPTEVRTILNNNNIFADTGDVEVKYLIEVI